MRRRSSRWRPRPGISDAAGSNSDGWQSLVSGPYYATGAPSATLVEAQDSNVPSQTGYTYDGDGRVTGQIAYKYGSETWETDTAYGGDYTTVTPPSGGTAQTTYVNGDGNTSYIYQYHAAAPPASPPAPGSGSAAGDSGWDQTAYTYTPAGQLAGISDAAGSKWSYAYDLAGDQVSQTTPDTGTTTATYDPAGNLLSSADAAGQTVSYTYDADGRKTAEYSGPVSAQSGTDEIASWLYDTIKPGLPTSSTSYVGGTSGSAYTQQVLGYFAGGEPTGTETIIPSSAGALAGTYKQSYAYNSYTDQESSYYDTAAGGLPAEQVSTNFDTSGDPVSLTSTLWPYVAQLSYTNIGQPQAYKLGTTSSPVSVLDSYDPETGALDSAVTQAGTTPVTDDDMSYTYDDAGLITSEDDDGSGTTPEDQCYTYNYDGELANAWAQDTASCAASPSTAILGGPAAYWQQMTYDATGNITESDTTFGAPGSQSTVDETDSYGTGSGASGPHQLGSQEVVASAYGYWTNTQSYNAAGQLTGTAMAGTQTSSLSWNAAGQLVSDTSSSNGTTTTAGYVYDASGDLLLQTDGTTSTLYLGDEQITDTDGTLTGTRYYAIGGAPIAARTSTGTIQYLVADQQGTSYLTINADTMDAARRYYNPWGGSLQFNPADFPGNQGFVGGTTDTATGLVNLGAREYNPVNGQFITTDPILNPDDPLDLNPYAYAGNDPVSQSDPSGLYRTGPGGCGPETYACPGSSPKPPPPPGPGNGKFNAGICVVNISACENDVWASNGGHETGSGPTNGGYHAPTKSPGYCDSTQCTSVFGTTVAKPKAPRPQVKKVPAVKKVSPVSRIFGWLGHTADSFGHLVWRYKVPIGIGLGIVAFGTGIGAVAVGVGTLGILLGTGAAVAGGGAAVLDREPCLQGDRVACFGLAAGLLGAVTGFGALPFFSLPEDGVVDVALKALGAFGLSVGAFGTAGDIGSALGGR